jgi:hypothetical protein
VLKSRTGEPEKLELLGNGCVTCNCIVTAGGNVFIVVDIKAAGVSMEL